MTLAVNQTDAQRVFCAVANGELTVGLLTEDTDATARPQPPPSTTSSSEVGACPSSSILTPRAIEHLTRSSRR